MFAGLVKSLINASFRANAINCVSVTYKYKTSYPFDRNDTRGFSFRLVTRLSRFSIQYKTGETVEVVDTSVPYINRSPFLRLVYLNLGHEQL